jgi:hypothetical protein
MDQNIVRMNLSRCMVPLEPTEEEDHLVMHNAST